MSSLDVSERARETSAAVRFSVIVPAFDAEHTLEATVRSALGQRTGGFEIIISDDGSTDCTLALARRLAESDPRVRVVTAENGGCSAARNRAFEVARGEFGVLLDSDDLLGDGYLERMSAFVDSHPGLDIYSCNGTRRYPSGIEEPFFRKPEYSAETSWTLDDLIPEDRIFLMSVVRKGLWERVGGFRTDLRYAEDYDFWLRALAAGASHRYLPERLATAVFLGGGKSKNLLAHAEAQLRMFRDLSERPSLTAHQCTLIAEKLAALRARIERVKLEERLSQGDHTDALATYRGLALAYDSTRMYRVGLALMTVSPALFWAVFSARRAGRMGQ